AVAIKGLAFFGPDAIAGDDRHTVANGMALHRAPPHAAGVEVRVIGFRANSGWIKQDFRTQQRHCPRCFGIPLVPAYPDAEGDAEQVPHFKTAIAGTEIEFFLVTRTIRNMRLAIDAHDLAIGIDYRDAVIIMLPVTLEKARWNGDLQLPGKFLHRQNRRAFLRWSGH